MEKILYVDAIQQYETETGETFDPVKATDYFREKRIAMQPKSVCPDCFMQKKHEVCP